MSALTLCAGFNAFIVSSSLFLSVLSEQEAQRVKELTLELKSTRKKLAAIADLCMRVFQFMDAAVPHGGATQRNVARFQRNFNSLVAGFSNQTGMGKPMANKGTRTTVGISDTDGGDDEVSSDSEINHVAYT